MAKFHVSITVEAEGLTATSVEELFTEEIRHYGDFDYTIKVTKVEEPKARTCQNCLKPDPYDDHWEDLDGPNRQGYNCQRYRPSIGEEVRAMKEKLRNG